MSSYPASFLSRPSKKLQAGQERRHRRSLSNTNTNTNIIPKQGFSWPSSIGKKEEVGGRCASLALIGGAPRQDHFNVVNGAKCALMAGGGNDRDTGSERRVRTTPLTPTTRVELKERGSRA